MGAGTGHGYRGMGAPGQPCRPEGLAALFPGSLAPLLPGSLALAPRLLRLQAPEVGRETSHLKVAGSLLDADIPGRIASPGPSGPPRGGFAPRVHRGLAMLLHGGCQSCQ